MGLKVTIAAEGPVLAGSVAEQDRKCREAAGTDEVARVQPQLQPDFMHRPCIVHSMGDTHKSVCVCNNIKDSMGYWDYYFAYQVNFDLLQNLEIPVVTYRKEGQYMDVDLSVQSEATAE
ncbi:hypothetical protein ACQJBY_058293 [Aegilops geniculata]